MGRGKSFILVSAVIILSAAVHINAQEPKELKPADVPVTGATPQAFVPRGWKIDASAEGDLNSDNVPDSVVRLVPAGYNSEGVTSAPDAQALLILLSTPDGKLKRAALSTQLLETEAPQYSVELTIKKGVVSIHQNYGMSDVIDTTHRFRYDAASGRFLLIGFDNNPYHRPQGPEWPSTWTSDNYLTGVRITTTDHWLKNGTNKPTEKREPIKRKVIAFEDVNGSSDSM